MSTTRIAAKALQHVKVPTKYSSIRDMPPAISHVASHNPAAKKRLEQILRRLQHQAAVSGILAQDPTTQPLVPLESATKSTTFDTFGQGNVSVTASKETAKITLNLPKRLKDTEMGDDLISMVDPKFKVFDEWKRTYLEYVRNGGDASKIDVTPLGELEKSGLLAENFGEAKQLDQHVEYDTLQQAIEDQQKRGNLVPKDFNSEEKTPKDSVMFDLLRKHLKEAGYYMQKLGLAQKKADAAAAAAKKKKATSEEEDAELEEEVVEEVAPAEESDDVISELREHWGNLDYDKKKQLYQFLLFMDRSEVLARDETRRRRKETVDKIFSTLSAKVKEMKEMTKKEYQLPQHDYEIVFGVDVRTQQSYLTRSQDEQEMLLMPITVLKRRLESIAERMTADASSAQYDPVKAHQDYNLFERTMNIFMQRLAERQFGDQSTLRTRQGDVMPADLLTEEEAAKSLPYHIKLINVYDAVVKRGEPFAKFNGIFQQIKSQSFLPNAGRTFNQQAMLKYPKQFEAAAIRLNKEENKMLEQLIAKEREFTLGQLSGNADLSAALKARQEIEDVSEKFQDPTSKYTPQERAAEAKRMSKLSAESEQKTYDAVQAALPNLKPALDVLRSISNLLLANRNKIADELYLNIPLPSLEGESWTEVQAAHVAKSLTQETTPEEYRAIMQDQAKQIAESKDIFSKQSEIRLRGAQELDAQIKQQLAGVNVAELISLVDAATSRAPAELKESLKLAKRNLAEAHSSAFLKNAQTKEKQLRALMNKQAQMTTPEAVEENIKQHQFSNELKSIVDELVSSINENGVNSLVNDELFERLVQAGKAVGLDAKIPSMDKDYLKNDPNRDLYPPHTISTTTSMGQLHEGYKYPGDKKIKLQVKVSDIKLSEHARARLLQIVGPRYNQTRDTITLTTETFPDKEQNIAYARQLLVELIKEARKADTDEAYRVVVEEQKKLTPEEILAQELANVEEEDLQAEKAMEVWRRIRKTGKSTVGPDLTYGEGIVERKKVEVKEERKGDDLGYSQFEDDAEDLFDVDEEKRE